MTTFIMGNQFVGLTPGKKEDAIDPKSLEGIFTGPEVHVSEKMPISPKENIREDWEQLKSSSKLTNNPEDAKALKPSNAGSETYYGGTDINSTNKPGIFDPEFKFKESEFTEHTIEAGKQRRRKIEERGKPSDEARAEWEQVTAAKTTADVPVTASGIMPNRSAYEPKDLPEVNLDITNKASEKTSQSIQAGKEAASIKEKLDAVLQFKEDSVSDNWEEEALDNITQNASRPMEFAQSPTTAPNFVPQTPSTDNPLAGLFPMPADPNEAPEENIRRQSSHLKQKRQRRQDDRSWEMVSKPTRSH